MSMKAGYVVGKRIDSVRNIFVGSRNIYLDYLNSVNKG